MTTLHHIDMALINVRHRLNEEMQFGADGKRVIMQAIDAARLAVKVVADRLDDIETAVANTLDERQRALAISLGTPGPQPETIEQEPEEVEQTVAPARKPKLVKQQGGES